MRPMLLTVLLLASLRTFPQSADSSQPNGTISGTVLDQYGQPFKGVQVCTYMMNAPSGSKESRGDCAATTDNAGEFRIDHVAMGIFGVEAIKPDQGYIAFAGTSVKQVLTVTPNQSSATVVLKLGPKAGVLLLSVSDTNTGKPVTSYLFKRELVDPGKPYASYSGGQSIERPGERALVPPGKNLRLKIWARGYKEWFYHDESDPSQTAIIRLEPGEEKELLVELEPQAAAAR